MRPLWRRDGRELFYVTQDRRFVVRPIQTGATLGIGPATVLFQTTMALSINAYFYAVTSDGQR